MLLHLQFFSQYLSYHFLAVSRLPMQFRLSVQPVNLGCIVVSGNLPVARTYLIFLQEKFEATAKNYQTVAKIYKHSNNYSKNSAHYITL